MHKVIVFCFLWMNFSIFALNIPNYIQPCKLQDPNLDECALKQARLAYPFIIKGDKTYKTPPLNPLYLPLIDIDAGANLRLKMKELAVNGLDKLIFKSANFDLKNNKTHFNLTASFNFIGKYEINGHILVLPIMGNGNCNVTFSGGDYVYDISWIFIERDNQIFAKIDKTNLEMKLKRAHFYFDNLFNGDKLLGENMNMVLNDNWEDVMKEVGAGIKHTIEVVVNGILEHYFENIPYKEIFV